MIRYGLVNKYCQNLHYCTSWQNLNLNVSSRRVVARNWTISKSWHFTFAAVIIAFPWGGYFYYLKRKWSQRLESDLSVCLCDFFLRIKEHGPCRWQAMWALTASQISLSTSPSARASASIFSALVPCHTNMLKHRYTQDATVLLK